MDERQESQPKASPNVEKVGTRKPQRENPSPEHVSKEKWHKGGKKSKGKRVPPRTKAFTRESQRAERAGGGGGMGSF
jgi:hypothetical protein